MKSYDISESSQVWLSLLTSEERQRFTRKKMKLYCWGTYYVCTYPRIIHSWIDVQDFLFLDLSEEQKGKCGL